MTFTYILMVTVPRSLFKRFITAAYYCMGLIIVMTTRSAVAANLEKPVPERQAFIQTETNDTIHPWVMAKTEDGGYLVAGEIGVSAGIIKTDGVGKPLWQYSTYAHQMPAYPYQEAMYRGVVPMPDGSAWACGFIPILKEKQQKGLLTHLDAKGRVIDERVMALPGAPLVRLYTCARWEANLAVVGTVFRVDKTHPRPNGSLPSSTSYWIIVLDPSGKVKWEKEISTGDPDSLDVAEGATLLVVGSNLVLSTTNNSSSWIASFDANGEVQAQKTLRGYFLLIRPVSPNGLLQVFGHLPDGPHAIITLDDHLAEVQTVRRDHPLSFLTRMVYGMPDGSYVLFGSSTHRLGEQYRSAVAHVDSMLANKRLVDLDRDVLDIGSIWAATPAHKAEEFVTARIFFKADRPGETSGRHGAVLDFIKFK